MPELETAHMGRLSYNEQDVLEFPDGLPGFDGEHKFLAVQVPSAKPILLFQSLSTPGLCFMTLPVLAVDPAFRLNMAQEDLRTIGFEENRQPAIGPDVLCAAILSVSENTAATVNLLAPLVVNFKTHRAVQAIQVESNYSHQHPLMVAEPEVACS